jgi:hypothetical protein
METANRFIRHFAAPEINEKMFDMKRCLHREHFSGSQRFASFMRRHIPQQVEKSQPEDGVYDSQVIKIINVSTFMNHSGSFFPREKISSGDFLRILR